MEWVKLGDIGKIITGNTPSKKNKAYYDSSDINFVSPGDIVENNRINQLTKSENHISNSAREKARMVPKNSILVTCIGIIGKVARVKLDEVAFNQQINAIVVDENIYDIDYIAYAIMANKRKLSSIANAAVVPLLNKSQFSDFKIFIEKSLDKQKDISSFLNKIETLIQTRQDQVQALDDLVESTFFEMFGDVQENSKSLISKKLGDVVKVNQGLQIAKSQRFGSEVENSYKYITIRYLNGNSDAEYIQNPQASVVCNKDDILVARTGNTGQIVTGVDGVFHNNFFKVNYDKNQFNKTYLYKYLTNKKIQDKMLMLAGTSTIPDLIHKDFYSIDVLIPPISQQNHFAAFVEKIEKQKQILNDSLGQLTMLFDSLMQDAFDGSMSK